MMRLRSMRAVAATTTASAWPEPTTSTPNSWGTFYCMFLLCLLWPSLVVTNSKDNTLFWELLIFYHFIYFHAYQIDMPSSPRPRWWLNVPCISNSAGSSTRPCSSTTRVSKCCWMVSYIWSFAWAELISCMIRLFISNKFNPLFASLYCSTQVVTFLVPWICVSARVRTPAMPTTPWSMTCSTQSPRYFIFFIPSNSVGLCQIFCAWNLLASVTVHFQKTQNSLFLS